MFVVKNWSDDIQSFVHTKVNKDSELIEFFFTPDQLLFAQPGCVRIVRVNKLGRQQLIREKIHSLIINFNSHPTFKE